MFVFLKKWGEAWMDLEADTRNAGSRMQATAEDGQNPERESDVAKRRGQSGWRCL
jgi:hypothetical protein